MEKEQILDFTRRISQSNRSGLTVINYEIIFAYLDDAKKAYQEEKWEEFKVALRKAQNSIGELMQTLDFSYDISRNLYRIYVFCKDSLAAAMYKRSLTEIENAEKMLRKLYQSFCKGYCFYAENPAEYDRLCCNCRSGQIFAGVFNGMAAVAAYQGTANRFCSHILHTLDDGRCYHIYRLGSSVFGRPNRLSEQLAVTAGNHSDADHMVTVGGYAFADYDNRCLVVEL